MSDVSEEESPEAFRRVVPRRWESRGKGRREEPRRPLDGVLDDCSEDMESSERPLAELPVDLNEARRLL